MDASAWPEDITTSATAETLAADKIKREIFKFADDVVDELDRLLHKYALWRVLRVSAWPARYITTAGVDHDETILAVEMKSEKFEEDQQQFKLQLNNNALLKCCGRIRGFYPVYLPDRAVYTVKFVK